MPIPNNQQQMQLNVSRKDIIDAPTVQCECGHKVFQHAVILKEVPGFMLGMGCLLRSLFVLGVENLLLLSRMTLT